MPTSLKLIYLSDPDKLDKAVELICDSLFLDQQDELFKAAYAQTHIENGMPTYMNVSEIPRHLKISLVYICLTKRSLQGGIISAELKQSIHNILKSKP